MVTRVGKQTSFMEAVKELVELDYDAIEAYEAAISRLENLEYKNKLKEFKDDHRKHVRELSDFLSRAGEKAPTGPDSSKSLLAKGKVVVSAMLDDNNILKAMLSNEEDTNTAYERMKSRLNEALDERVTKAITNGLEDEKKHKDWLNRNIEKP